MHSATFVLALALLVACAQAGGIGLGFSVGLNAHAGIFAGRYPRPARYGWLAVPAPTAYYTSPATYGYAAPITVGYAVPGLGGPIALASPATFATAGLLAPPVSLAAAPTVVAAKA